MLALAGLVNVPYDPLLILGAFGLLVLLAFTVSAFGVLVAVTIKQAQTFTWVMQLVVFPMVFLSGALYPVAGLPAWLEVLNRISPLTYAVDPMRRLVFSHLDVSETARRTLDPGVTWFGWHLPPLFEVAMVLLLGLRRWASRSGGSRGPSDGARVAWPVHVQSKGGWRAAAWSSRDGSRPRPSRSGSGPRGSRPRRSSRRRCRAGPRADRRALGHARPAPPSRAGRADVPSLVALASKP